MSDDDLLPGNATAFERAMSSASARISATHTEAVRRERDPVRCRAERLPFVAMERSVHHYTGDDIALDRVRTWSSFPDHCGYGAAAGLEREIALDTGQDVRVLEFFEDPSLEWPEFAVETIVEPGEPTPDLAALWRSAIHRKNVRDWPRLRLATRAPVAPLYIAAASHVSPTVRILPEEALPPPRQLFIGAAQRVVVKVEVQPQ